MHGNCNPCNRFGVAKHTGCIASPAGESYSWNLAFLRGLGS